MNLWGCWGLSDKIELHDVKSIGHLTFEIPSKGVWLLTGGNGSGKTSLLACLARIGEPQAFRIHFPSSSDAKLDSYRRARVEYHAGGYSVSYIRGSERWVPRPRKDSSKTLKAFGFKSVVFLRANEDRISALPEDLKPGTSSAASDFIREGAKRILADERFEYLRTVKARRQPAFLLRFGKNSPYSYNSERSFSLGELSVVKMLRTIEDVPNNSLLLVDELEMALHPNAQVRLYDFLAKLADERDLTVIFSTHSSTLIKHVKRKTIIHVDRDGSSHSVVLGAFPSYVLGQMAGQEERGYDKLILCEDEAAEEILSHYWLGRQTELSAAGKPIPKIAISPIGDFNQVLRSLETALGGHPEHIAVCAVLDADVETESIPHFRLKDPHGPFLQRYDRLRKHVSFLPFAPELGAIQHLAANLDGMRKLIRAELNDFQIKIATDLSWLQDEFTEAEKRKKAKTALKAVLGEISNCCKKDTIACKRAFFKAFAVSYEKSDSDTVQKLKGQAFS